jgi:uronate dehydrogenase
MNAKQFRILITGAAGRIGRVVSAALAEHELVLFDRLPVQDAPAGARSITAELSDSAALDQAMQGVQCLIHLAAIPDESPFEQLLEPNILGAYQAFEAARRAGVARIVYASSIQAVGFQPMRKGVGQDSRIRPSGYYGVTKAFGEALGSLYADKFGISVACLRIASFDTRPRDRRHLSTWLSHADCARLFKACVEAPPFSFRIVYGVSANRHSVVRDAVPGAIGYRPQDDAEPFRQAIEAGPADKPETVLFSGGEFCGRGFVGDFSRIE